MTMVRSYRVTLRRWTMKGWCGLVSKWGYGYSIYDTHSIMATSIVNRENAGRLSHLFDLGVLSFKTHLPLLWSGDFAQSVRSTLIPVPLRMTPAVPRKFKENYAELLEKCPFLKRWIWTNGPPKLSICRSVMDHDRPGWVPELHMLKQIGTQFHHRCLGESAPAEQRAAEKLVTGRLWMFSSRF